MFSEDLTCCVLCNLYQISVGAPVRFPNFAFETKPKHSYQSLTAGLNNCILKTTI